MRSDRNKAGLRRGWRAAWMSLASRLTPQEKKAFLFIAGLFLLGAAVRWFRTGNGF